MKQKVFYIDDDNKLYNKLKSSLNIFEDFLRDMFFIGLGMPVVFYLLTDASPINGVYFYSSYSYAIIIGFLYPLIVLLLNLIIFGKFLNIANTAVSKMNNNIIIYKDVEFKKNGVFKLFVGSQLGSDSKSLLGSSASMLIMDKGMKDMNASSTPNMVSNDSLKKMYNNCKLIKEKRNYYVFSGEINGKLTKFRVYKIYENIEQITMEDM